jgi:hypothetical protein
MSDDILVAKESFSTEINGVPRAVTKGETFREGHPVVEGREEMFKPFKIDNEIETATAAPGEKRRRTRAKKAEAGEEKAEKSAAEESAETATAAPGESSAPAEQDSTGDSQATTDQPDPKK